MAFRLQAIRNHLSSSSPKTIIRTMSSSTAPRKFEWLVVVPDFPDALQKRLAVRPQHFEGLKDQIASGELVMGGAVLEEMPQNDEPSSLKFAGSSVVLQAESREQVIEILKGDIYTKSGVWDVANAQIWPLKCAFRAPLGSA